MKPRSSHVEAVAAVNWHVADYREPPIPSYRGNPLVEALTIGSMDTVTILDLFSEDPEFHIAEREANTIYRLDACGRLRTFRQPFVRHATLFSEIQHQILSGYKGRSPETAHYHIRVKQRHEEARRQGGWAKEPPRYVSPGAITLLGTSGAGKTAAVQACVGVHPEAIQHPMYGIVQVPCLTVDCPAKGTTKQLGLAILRALDERLHTGYYKLYRSGSSREVMADAALCLAKHFVGVLVIDETQNLLNLREGREHILAALVQLANRVEVPFVFVGTPQAGELMTETFAQARRTGSVSIWGPLEAAKIAESEFSLFCEAIWEFQWIRNPQPITLEMLCIIYDATAGVPELIVHLFKACQEHIIRSGQQPEVIDASVLSRVAREKFSIFRKAVTALISGENSSLFDDLYLPNALLLRGVAR